MTKSDVQRLRYKLAQIYSMNLAEPGQLYEALFILTDTFDELLSELEEPDKA